MCHEEPQEDNQERELSSFDANFGLTGAGRVIRHVVDVCISWPVIGATYVTVVLYVMLG